MRKSLLLGVAVLASSFHASAAAITVVNPSFEADVLASGSFNIGSITGWTSVGTSGAFRPIIGTEFNSIPDGSQTGYSNGGALSQVLSSLLANNTVYTLQVDVGKRLDCCTGFAPIVELFAGTSLLGTAPAANPAIGNFLTETFVYTSLVSDPNAGKALKIVLDSGGTQTDFDNVRLGGVALAATTAPEPGTVALFGAGLGALLAVKKRAAK
jgi:hypothetical protein